MTFERLALTDDSTEEAISIIESVFGPLIPQPEDPQLIAVGGKGEVFCTEDEADAGGVQVVQPCGDQEPYYKGKINGPIIATILDERF